MSCTFEKGNLTNRDDIKKYCNRRNRFTRKKCQRQYCDGLEVAGDIGRALKSYLNINLKLFELASRDPTYRGNPFADWVYRDKSFPSIDSFKTELKRIENENNSDFIRKIWSRGAYGTNQNFRRFVENLDKIPLSQLIEHLDNIDQRLSPNNLSQDVRVPIEEINSGLNITRPNIPKLNINYSFKGNAIPTAPSNKTPDILYIIPPGPLITNSPVKPIRIVRSSKKNKPSAKFHPYSSPIKVDQLVSPEKLSKSERILSIPKVNGYIYLQNEMSPLHQDNMQKIQDNMQKIQNYNEENLLTILETDLLEIDLLIKNTYEKAHDKYLSFPEESVRFKYFKNFYCDSSNLEEYIKKQGIWHIIFSKFTEKYGMHFTEDEINKFIKKNESNKNPDFLIDITDFLQALELVKFTLKTNFDKLSNYLEKSEKKNNQIIAKHEREYNEREAKRISEEAEKRNQIFAEDEIAYNEREAKRKSEEEEKINQIIAEHEKKREDQKKKYTNDLENAKNERSKRSAEIKKIDEASKRGFTPSAEAVKPAWLIKWSNIVKGRPPQYRHLMNEAKEQIDKQLNILNQKPELNKVAITTLKNEIKNVPLLETRMLKIFKKKEGITHNGGFKSLRNLRKRRTRKFKKNILSSRSKTSSRQKRKYRRSQKKVPRN